MGRRHAMSAVVFWLMMVAIGPVQTALMDRVARGRPASMLALMIGTWRLFERAWCRTSSLRAVARRDLATIALLSSDFLWRPHPAGRLMRSDHVLARLRGHAR